ncbi:unannotated protein [freshwater metagenome]|uniref:Unannotated protein n=1 Tax=freshwater metagenome TaxID=449393 RepID=A0A6J7DP79_9ZZZZ
MAPEMATPARFHTYDTVAVGVQAAMAAVRVLPCATVPEIVGVGVFENTPRAMDSVSRLVTGAAA